MPKTPKIFVNNINKYHLYLSISVWKDYFNTKKRYEDILGRTSEAILNANKFTTPWQRQNIEMECLKMIKILALKLQTRLPMPA